MKTNKIALLYILLIFGLLTFNKSCNERNETVSCFPNSAISVSLNLNLVSYYDLNNVGGWIYVNQVGAGTQGLIVVRTSSGFKVYDRNAPHLCPNGTDDTVLKVQDGTKIVCPKDNAQWILLTGQPISVAKVAPKSYAYSYDPNTNILSVYN